MKNNIFLLFLLTTLSCTGNRIAIQDVNLGDEHIGGNVTNTLSQDDIKILNKGFQEGKKIALENKKAILDGIVDLPLDKENYDRCKAIAERNILDSKHADFLRLNKRIKTARPIMQWAGAVTWGIRKNFRYYTGLRTKEQQRKLVEEGKSTTMRSQHLLGLAADIYICDRKKGCKLAKWRDNLQFGVAAGVFATVVTLLREKTGCEWYADNSPDWIKFHDPGHHAIYDRPRYERDKEGGQQLI